MNMSESIPRSLPPGCVPRVHTPAGRRRLLTAYMRYIWGFKG